FSQDADGLRHELREVVEDTLAEAAQEQIREISLLQQDLHDDIPSSCTRSSGAGRWSCRWLSRSDPGGVPTDPPGLATTRELKGACPGARKSPRLSREGRPPGAMPWPFLGPQRSRRGVWGFAPRRGVSSAGESRSRP